MAPQAAQFDLSSAFLNIPKTVAYGLVRGAGNLVLQQALTDGTRVSFYMLGEGPWDSILRLWINNKLVALPSSSTVHFHPGLDGEIGNGLSFSSTGGDQHVDEFFTLLPGGLDPITFSRYAWLALKTAPDPAAPSADLTVLADYQAMQVRQFDSSGNQTSFAWTQNWAWIICDYLIRKFVLREGKVNQPLVAAELARFDWQSFSDAAAYYDASLGAPPAYVQNVEVDQPAGSSTTWSFVLPSNVQAGSLLVFANREGTVTSVTDNKGNTWVKLYNSFWYALNAIAGATTVTATFSSANHMQGTVAEYSGVANAAPDVSANLASGTGTTATSTSVTPTASGDLILAWGNNSTTNTPVYTAGAGFSLRSTASKNSFIEDKIQSVAGALTATLTINASDAWNIGIVAFKAQPAGSGQKRFSDGGVVYVNDSDTADSAIEQMLLMCRSYLLERDGKLSLYADQPRSPVFTFTSDNTLPASFKAYKTNLRAASNRIVPTYRDLNLAGGSSDDATRFAIASDPVMDHEAHQRTAGARGPGLSVLPKITELDLDFGVNTPERVWRLCKSMLVRQLGDDVDANTQYNAPFSMELTGFEDSSAVECGDVVTIDRSMSEEYGGKLFEVQEIDENPDGTRQVIGLEYEPNAFPDVAPAQQQLQAPDPGSGLPPIATGVDANGNQQIGVSTALNAQGNLPASVMAAGPIAFSTKAPAGIGIVQMSWAAFAVTRGDGSVVNIPANTSQPVPAAPAVSSVAGGALAARTLFFRIALVKDNIIMSVSGETSFSKAINTLFKVTSPASQSGYDGWIPLSGGTTGLCGCISGATVSGILVNPIAFGTDYTEPTSGISGVGQSVDQLPTPPSPAGSGTLTTPINLLLAPNTAYFFYPLWDLALTMMRFAGGVLSAVSTVAAQKQSADGKMALNAGALSFTTPTSGGSGGGSGGGGGGGRGTL